MVSMGGEDRSWPFESFWDDDGVETDADISDSESQEVTTGPNDRYRCTDCGWTVLFLCLLALRLVLELQRTSSFVEPLISSSWLADSHGQLCGSALSNNSGRPLLYYCLDGSSNRTAAACIADCPSEEVPIECPPGFRTPYNTSLYIGMICAPLSAHGVKREWDKYIALCMTGTSNFLIVYLSPLWRAWQLFVASAVSGIMFSASYFIFLSRASIALIENGLTVVCVVPVVVGTLLLLLAHVRHANDRDNLHPIVSGTFLLCLGLGVTCAVMQHRVAITTAASCLNRSCNAVVACRSLQLQPFISALMRLVTIFGLLLSLMAHRLRIAQQGHSGWMLISAIFTFLMDVWIFHLLSALSNFVIAFTTEAWYFNGGGVFGPARSSCGALTAYWRALRYHSGSLILGSLVVGLLHPIRAIIGAITAPARILGGWGGRVFRCLCCLTPDWFENYLGQWDKHAFMEMAMVSKPFCESAEDGWDLLLEQYRDAATILNTITRVFQFAGICAAACIGMVASWLSLSGADIAKGFHDPDDPHFVENAELVYVGGGVVAALVSIPGLALLDTVADSILYCDAMVKQYSQAQAAQRGWLDDAGSFVADMTCACARKGAKAPRGPPLEFGGSSGPQTWPLPASPQGRGPAPADRSEPEPPPGGWANPWADQR